jgi:hypothetical protein
MAIYDKSHKNAQCASALGLLEIAEQHKAATAAMCELLIKSYGLGCSAKLGKPREFMLSKKDPMGLFLEALKESEKRYGGTYVTGTDAGNRVAKQALYLLCGRNSSNKVTDDCQQWRNATIDLALAESGVAAKPAEKPKTTRKPRAKKA